MDTTHFIVFFLLGCSLGLVIYSRLGAKRRVQIPPLGWLPFLVLGVIICIYGLSHSTTPSFLPQTTAVGNVYDYVERKIGSGRGQTTIFGFRFVPEGGESVHIETQIRLPYLNHSEDFDGRTFRIVYLKDSKRETQNEAIDITILSGKGAGFHDSLDARPFGAWLGIPIGAAFLAFAITGIQNIGKDENSDELDEDDNSST